MQVLEGNTGMEGAFNEFCLFLWICSIFENIVILFVKCSPGKNAVLCPLCVLNLYIKKKTPSAAIKYKISKSNIILSDVKPQCYKQLTAGGISAWPYLHKGSSLSSYLYSLTCFSHPFAQSSPGFFHHMKVSFSKGFASCIHVSIAERDREYLVA